MARPTKHDHEKRSATERYRVTIAERAYIRAQAKAAGLTPSEYSRRRALGYEVPAKSAAAPNAAMVSELNRIGVNINQLARSVHRGSAFQEFWLEIGDEINGILAQLVSEDGS